MDLAAKKGQRSRSDIRMVSFCLNNIYGGFSSKACLITSVHPFLDKPITTGLCSQLLWERAMMWVLERGTAVVGPRFKSQWQLL